MTLLYSELANRLIQHIEKGVYQIGERLPGVRQTSLNEGVSPSTAVAAYRRLEDEGYIEARPRSGYYVRQQPHTQLAEPRTSNPPKKPRLVSGQELVLQLARNSDRKHIVNLGTAIPDPSYLPTQAMNRTIAALGKEYRARIHSYEFPPGLIQLRQEITKRLALAGCTASHDDIVITNGCQEAIFISLKSVTSPGDIVAVESPVYHGLLQVIDALGLKALEIPTSPRDGISIEALQLALEQWPIKACVVIPSFSNPLGSLMSDERKQALLTLIDKYHEVTLIEDDIYGELSFSDKRPRALKSFDNKDKVIYCSSVSKTLSPGMRVGWVLSEKHHATLCYQKYVTNSASPFLNQMAVASFFNGGRYDRHLRNLRSILARSSQRVSAAICEHFPEQTRITRPEGGYVLWLELPTKIDTETLQQEALNHGISIAPGNMFSLTKKYGNCMRISCALPWSDRVEKAIVKLSMLIRS